MSHDHTKPCSCCSSHYPDLLQKICPTRAWEVDSTPTQCPFEFPNPKSNPLQHCCKCASTKKVKGKFGVAWICETPDCSCCEPYGWQVEFVDTPAKVEERCRELIEWVNNPPLPKDDCKCGAKRQVNLCCCSEQPENPPRCSCESPERDKKCCSCSNKNKDGDLIEVATNDKVSFHSPSNLNQAFSNSRQQQQQQSAVQIVPSTTEAPPARRSRGAAGTPTIHLTCCNEKCLQRAGEGVEIARRNANQRTTCNRKPVECCTNNRRQHVVRSRRRMVWLPAQATRVLLRNLKAYLSSALHRDGCQCSKENVQYVVCQNKIVS